ncbi:MAG: YicC family protein, partial [Desulfobacterales bacterium]
KIKALIADRVTRGRVEIRVQIDDSSEIASELEVDFSRAKALFSAFTELKSELGFKNDISLDMLIRSGGLIKTVEKVQKEDIVWPVVKNCITLALDDCEAMRQKEGDFIAGDFSRRLNFINGCLEQIHKKSEGLLTLYQQRLKERIAQLTQNSVELDPARIAQEAAFLADRSDVTEEIVRAKSHLNQFKQMMNAVEPVGRKLNFLLQELNREFNTMGAKIGNADMSHLIIDVKSELEKIREQIQNVE